MFMQMIEMVAEVMRDQLEGAGINPDALTAHSTPDHITRSKVEAHLRANLADAISVYPLTDYDMLRGIMCRPDVWKIVMQREPAVADRSDIEREGITALTIIRYNLIRYVQGEVCREFGLLKDDGSPMSF